MRSLAVLNSHIIACAVCPRLVTYRRTIAVDKRRQYRDWTYWGRPVPGFGDPHARLYVLGLAPAAHGGNRTGQTAHLPRVPAADKKGPRPARAPDGASRGRHRVPVAVAAIARGA